MKQYANKLNWFLERAIPVTTLLGVIIGFLFPSVFINLRPLVPWLFGLLTFSGALKLRAAELGAAVRSPIPILYFFAAVHIIMPIIARFSSALFFTDLDVISGFVLLFAGPTAVSGFFWILIYKGNKALALSLILLDTLLAPLVVPGTLLILIGTKVEMNMSGIALSLIMMIVIPTIFGVAVNEISKGKMPAQICPYLDPLSKIFLLFIIAANTSALAGKVNFGDPLVWKIAAVCILLTVIGFYLAKASAVFGKCSRDKEVAITIAGGLRNNSAVMTLAVTFFPEADALPTLACLMTQQSIAAFAGKLFKKESSG
jgi:tagaturonate reductase